MNFSGLREKSQSKVRTKYAIFEKQAAGVRISLYLSAEVHKKKQPECIKLLF